MKKTRLFECGSGWVAGAVSAAAFLLAVAAGPIEAAGPADLAARITARPISVEMLDFSRTAGRMSSLEDSGSPAGRKTFHLTLDRGSIEVPTAQVGRIVVQPTQTTIIRSGPQVQTYLLGHGTAKHPEPPTWYLPDASIQTWEPAVAQWPFARWRYIPRGVWIWSEQPRHHPDNETVLFRHAFDLPATGSLVGAVLDLSADSFVESLFINGTSVRLPTESLLGEVVSWDVTHLLRPGRNLLAARVTNDSGEGRLGYAGFCYRIRCEMLPSAAGFSAAPPGVVLFLANEDRISGSLESIASNRWLVARNGQIDDIDSDWIELAVVNYGGPERTDLAVAGASPRSFFQSLLTPWKLFVKEQRILPAVTLRPQPSLAWNLDLEPVAARRGVLIRNGDWIEGRIEGLSSNRLHIKPRYGETFGVPIDRVALVQPNRPDPETQFLYRPADFPSVVRVRLANNDRITGALESLGNNTIAVTPQFSDSVRLPLSSVLRIDFEMNMTARYRARLTGAWSQPPPQVVAAIGEPDAKLKSGLDESIVAIQRTLQNLGIEMRWLRADQVVEPGRLAPGRFPVLLNFDQNERYFHTVRRRNDGFEAIRDYVANGGTLVQMARGEPFSRAYVAEDGQWRTRRPPSDLNQALMMNIVSHDKKARDAEPFELPPNRGQHMFFVLNRLSPFARDLPPRVDLPMIADMRFRPVTGDAVTSGSRFFPLYDLVDDTGENYGTAMAIIRYAEAPAENGTANSLGGFPGASTARSGKPHYGIYVSHLLYEASHEGKSMVEYLLPKALLVALGGNDLSIANLARQPVVSPVRAARAPDPDTDKEERPTGN